MKQQNLQYYKQFLDKYLPLFQELFYSKFKIFDAIQFKYLSFIRKKYQDNKLIVQKRREIYLKYHLKIISQKMHFILEKQSIVLNKFLHSLENKWKQYSIPLFHCYYFLKLLNNNDKIMQLNLIQQEIQKLQNKSHPIFYVWDTIKSRELCLTNLNKSMSELKESDLNLYLQFCNSKKEKINIKSIFYKKYYKFGNKTNQQQNNVISKIQDITKLLSNFRNLTKGVIEMIIQWKEYIKKIGNGQKKIKNNFLFLYDNQNYLLKILQDNKFIKKSILSTLFNFAPKYDPFLLYPSINYFQQGKYNTDQQILIKLISPNKQDLIGLQKVLKQLLNQYHKNLKKKKKILLQKHEHSNELVIVKNQCLHKQPISDRKNIQQRLQKMSNISQNQSKYFQYKLKKQKLIGNDKAILRQDYRQFIHMKKEELFQEGKIQEQIKKKNLSQYIQKKRKKYLLDKMEKQEKNRQQTQIISQRIIKSVNQNERYNKSRFSRIQQKNMSDNFPEFQVNLEKKKKKFQFINQQLPKNSFNQTQDVYKEIKNYVNSRFRKQILKGQFKIKSKQNFNFMNQFSINLNKSFLKNNHSEFYLQPSKIKQQKLCQVIRQTFNKYPYYLLNLFQADQDYIIQKIKKSIKYFIIDLVEKDDVIGTSFCCKDFNQISFKKIIIQLILIPNIEEFILFVQLLVKFLWTKEYADQIQMSILKQLNNKKYHQLTQIIQNAFMKKALLYKKKKYYHLQQQKYIFKNPYKIIVKDISNSTFNLFLEVLCVQKEFKKQQGVICKKDVVCKGVSFEFLLVQLIRKYFKKNEISNLHKSNDDKIKLMLELMEFNQKVKIKNKQISYEEGKNFQIINKILQSKMNKIYPFTDINQQNNINIITYNLQLKLLANILSTIYHQKPYFRLNFKQKIRSAFYKQNKILYLPTTNRSYFLMMMHAQQYLNSYKYSLLQYMHQILKNQIVYEYMMQQYVWIPQICINEPQVNQNQRTLKADQRNYNEVDYFDRMDKRIIFHQELKFFYRDFIKSGLQVQYKQTETLFQIPCLIALVHEKYASKYFPIYARLIQNST